MSNGLFRCERCGKRLQAQGRGSHSAKHARQDGKRARELGEKAARLVAHYNRIDDLEGALRYQVNEAAADSNGYILMDVASDWRAGVIEPAIEIAKAHFHTALEARKRLGLRLPTMKRTKGLK